MNDVRAFCSEPGYRSAVLLTFSFDAAFFERVVLPDLRAGGTGTTVVLADRREVEEAVHRWLEHACQVGRRYHLDLAGVRGRFHLKVFLRVGPKGGRVWVGTGNVTASGWGANRELSTWWPVGPGEADQGGWIAGFLRQVGRWTENPLAREAVTRIAEEDWVRQADGGPSAGAPLWSSEEAPLAAQLALRWAGRRFTSVRITTGSTDAEGAFLAWAHRTFGVERATIAVHAEAAGFERTALARLPVAVEFVEPVDPGGSHRTLHAKSYWFEGPNGPAAVVGSANCSRAAWELPLPHGGNVEAIVVTDHPDAEAWRSVLQVFEAPRRSPDEHLPEVVQHESVASNSLAYRLVGAEWDAETGTIRVRIAPDPGESARVEVLVGDESSPAARSAHEGGVHWEAPRPEAAGTLRGQFARARIGDGTAAETTGPRWIDDPAALRAEAQDRRASAVLARLSVATDTSEYRKVAEDLHLAMETILKDRSAFVDLPARAAPKRSAGDPGAEAPRLDPSRLAVAFRTPASPEAVLGIGSAAYSTSFGGVLHSLIATDDAAVPEEDEDASGDEGDEGSPGVPPSPARDVVRRPEPRPAPPDRLRRRLARQMEDYLKRLRGDAFARTCTATQLVEAVSLPLALAALGARSGWADAPAAHHWTVAAVTTLLHGAAADARDGGLLAAVRRRYEEAGNDERFRQAVGNGLLWAAAATVLAGLDWSGLGGRIRRALLLRDLFRRDDLTASAEPERLQALVSRFRVGDAIATIRDELPRADAALTELETWLQGAFDRLLAAQQGATGAHAAGDPLWGRRTGWVFVMKDAPISANGTVQVEPWRPGQFAGGTGATRVRIAGYYVNVRLAVEGAGATAACP